MPIIGEIRKAQDINKEPKNGKFIWHACEKCGRERWVHIVRGEPYNKLCKSCCKRGRATSETTKLKMSLAGRRNPNPNFKFIDRTHGYVWVHCYREDPLYPMSNKRNLVMEHRLVMAKHLGRSLTRREQVHHINGNRSDNRLENLELISIANHKIVTVLCQHCKIKKDNQLLRQENTQLLNQIKEMNLGILGRQ